MLPYDLPVAGPKDPGIDAYLTVDAAGRERVKPGYRIYVHVPAHYSAYGHLQEGDAVKALATLGFIVENVKTGALHRDACHVLGIVTMRPHSRGSVTIEGVDYREYTFDAGDILRESTSITQEASVTRTVYVEFMNRGKVPYWLMSYGGLATFMADAKALTGDAPATDAVIVELMLSHLSRTRDDKNVLFRHARLKGATDDDLVMVGARNVAYAPDGTAARTIGSYMSDGMHASLNTTATQHHQAEDILRGLVPIKRVEE